MIFQRDFFNCTEPGVWGFPQLLKCSKKGVNQHFDFTGELFKKKTIKPVKSELINLTQAWDKVKI